MKPIWKWAIGITASLIFLVLIGAWYLSKRWKPLVETKLREAVLTGTDSLYRISYNGIDFSLITGNAAVSHVQLTLDSAVYTRLEREQRAPDLTYGVTAQRIKLGGIGLLRMLLSRNLHISSLTIDTPAVNLTDRYHAYNDTTVADKPAKNLYQRIASFTDKLKIGQARVNGGRFALEKTKDATRISLPRIDIDVRDLLIDSLSQSDTARFYGARTIEMNLSGVEFIRADGLYALTAKRLHAVTDDGMLTIDSLRYYSLVSMAEFYRHKKVAEDMVDMDIPRIRLSDINLPRWITDQTIAAGTLHIDSGGTIAVSKDLFYPEPIENKIGRAPHQHLLNLKQPVAIDSIVVNDLDVSFAQLGEKSREESKVTFDHIQGVIRNATNDSLALAKNRNMVLDVNAKLMNAGELSVRFDFDLLDEAGGHRYQVRLGPMDGRLFNHVLTPLMPAEIASADIQGLNFNMRANNYRTSGSQQFDYRNLKLNVLKAKDESGERATQKLASFLINQLVINDSNPDANGKRHTASIDFERPRTYSFFKMIWQGIFEGVKQCMGLSQKDEERLLRAAQRGQ
ncbi:hypothetical protein [Parapedobacter lycopersici]|uniref:hypothetical protein n=1 Tax=Parapedobacter lycopersici TaxID=1864939 RepID=UPI00214DF01C|nr:hypothetical protein [Parapedobacter lycopersici]